MAIEYCCLEGVALKSTLDIDFGTVVDEMTNDSLVTIAGHCLESVTFKTMLCVDFGTFCDQ
jgi:hypothetical protein